MGNTQLKQKTQKIHNKFKTRTIWIKTEQRLKNSLQKYHHNKSLRDDINIQNVLNDYIHLMQDSNNNDTRFEYIYKFLGGYCNINQCSLFRTRLNKHIPN
eukprot:173049_1